MESTGLETAKLAAATTITGYQIPCLGIAGLQNVGDDASRTSCTASSPYSSGTRHRDKKEGRHPRGGKTDDLEVPGDIQAFFGHPLNAPDGGEGLALLHEYQSLTALHTESNGEKFTSRQNVNVMNSLGAKSHFATTYNHKPTSLFTESESTIQSHKDSPDTDGCHVNGNVKQLNIDKRPNHDQLTVKTKPSFAHTRRKVPEFNSDSNAEYIAISEICAGGGYDNTKSQIENCRSMLRLENGYLNNMPQTGPSGQNIKLPSIDALRRTAVRSPTAQMNTTAPDVSQTAFFPQKNRIIEEEQKSREEDQRLNEPTPRKNKMFSAADVGDEARSSDESDDFQIDFSSTDPAYCFSNTEDMYNDDSWDSSIIPVMSQYCMDPVTTTTTSNEITNKKSVQSSTNTLRTRIPSIDENFNLCFSPSNCDDLVNSSSHWDATLDSNSSSSSDSSARAADITRTGSLQPFLEHDREWLSVLNAVSSSSSGTESSSTSGQTPLSSKTTMSDTLLAAQARFLGIEDSATTPSPNAGDTMQDNSYANLCVTAFSTGGGMIAKRPRSSKKKSNDEGDAGSSNRRHSKIFKHSDPFSDEISFETFNPRQITSSTVDRALHLGFYDKSTSFSGQDGKAQPPQQLLTSLDQCRPQSSESSESFRHVLSPSSLTASGGMPMNTQPYAPPQSFQQEAMMNAWRQMQYQQQQQWFQHEQLRQHQYQQQQHMLQNRQQNQSFPSDRNQPLSGIQNTPEPVRYSPSIPQSFQPQFTQPMSSQQSQMSHSSPAVQPVFPGLPFPLPVVPPGFRLVITHQPLPSSEVSTQQQHVTQLIIDHPSYTPPISSSQSVTSYNLIPSSTSPATVQCNVMASEQFGAKSSAAVALVPSPTNLEMHATAKETAAVRPTTLNLHHVLAPDLIQSTQKTRQSELFSGNSTRTETPVTSRGMETDIESSASSTKPSIQNGGANATGNGVLVIQPIASPAEDILEKSMIEAQLMSSDASSLLQQQQQRIYQQRQQQPAVRPTTIPLSKLQEDSSNLFSPPSDIKKTNYMTSPMTVKMQSPCVSTPTGGVDCAARAPADVFFRPHSNYESNQAYSIPTSSLSSAGSDQGTSGWSITENDQISPAGRGRMNFSSPDDCSPFSNEGGLLSVANQSFKSFKRRSASSPSSRRLASRNRSSTMKGSHISFIPKIDPDLSGYSFYMEAPISTNPRLDEDRVTYMNKGQYYHLVLDYHPTDRKDFSCHGKSVKSVVMVMFRARHPAADELKTWEFWHSRQHSYKQRVLDIDSKICGESMPLSLDEIAYNAVAVGWNPYEAPVTLNIAINCLSTDFSHQKGVKGNPLHIQIDTYEDEASIYPIHRAYCQIKVFCDKGADRKAREEERKHYNYKTEQDGFDELRHEPCDRTHFYSVQDLTTPPVLFTPSDRPGSKLTPLNSEPTSNFCSTPAYERILNHIESEHVVSSTRPSRCYNYDSPRRKMLLVREKNETAFTALILESASLSCLTQAIQEKYNVPLQCKMKIYNETRKCSMIIKMDDNIIQHFANESTFLIDIRKVIPHSAHAEQSPVQDISYDVTLTEILPVPLDSNNR